MRSTPGRVIQIECNIDDMTAEALGYALERVLQAGALDAWFTPIQMKKNRPGTLFSLLCAEDERERFCDLLLEHTTTLGVRWHVTERVVTQRATDLVATPYGNVRRKLKLVNGRVTHIKPEYDDCARLAADAGVPLAVVADAARSAPCSYTPDQEASR